MMDQGVIWCYSTVWCGVSGLSDVCCHLVGYGVLLYGVG